MQPSHQRAQSTSYEIQQVIHIRLAREILVDEVLQHDGPIHVLHINSTPLQVYQIQGRRRNPLGRRKKIKKKEEDKRE